MNRNDWNELYTRLYAAYDYAGLRDEYVRSTLGDALDHMILLKPMTVNKLAQDPLCSHKIPDTLHSFT